MVVDLEQVGGIVPARACAAIAAAGGVVPVLGGRPSLGIATAAMLHLAAAVPAFSTANEIASRQLRDTVLVDRLEIADGMMSRAAVARPGRRDRSGENGTLPDRVSFSARWRCKSFMNRFSTASESCWALTTSPMEIMPAKRPLGEHGQVANAPRGHQPHDHLDLVVGRAGNQRVHIASRTLTSVSGLAARRRQAWRMSRSVMMPIKSRLPRGVRAADDQRADAMLDERSHHVLQGGVGRNQVDHAALDAENVVELHKFPLRPNTAPHQPSPQPPKPGPRQL